ncbi:NAD(P)-dependent alcohol dehydrogenase [Kribbella sp. NPDC051587]|uniref:NAD(P)-dependent alcohol dehydrogenase n=1 Tax=Kribbella sp. NPDC051587 TaxID=3364119 RepID=UPI0037B7FFAB
MPATTMRAAQYDRFGPPDVLYVAEVPVPTLKPGQLLIRVHATTVQGGEMSVRSGLTKRVSGSRLPRRIGTDFVGEIVATAEPGSDLEVGDHVWGCLPRDQYVRGHFGSASDFVAVPRDYVSLVPRGLDSVDAAALVVGVVADRGLRQVAELQAGESLLVRGAGGGVGILAVQLGKAWGARVTALASAKQADVLRSLGADEVLDYRSVSLEELPRHDVIFDTVGSDLATMRRRLTPKGRMVTIALDVNHLLRSVLTVAGSAMYGGQRIRFFSHSPRTADMAALTKLVEAGALRPVVDTVYPLEEIAQAHRDQEGGGVLGKRVIKVVSD